MKNRNCDIEEEKEIECKRLTHIMTPNWQVKVEEPVPVPENRYNYKHLFLLFFFI